MGTDSGTLLSLPVHVAVQSCISVERGSSSRIRAGHWVFPVPIQNSLQALPEGDRGRIIHQSFGLADIRDRVPYVTRSARLINSRNASTKDLVEER